MTNNVVYGCFVGTGGAFLPNFNSQMRPYPPIENDEGFIALGWGDVGTMLMYEKNYSLFESQFFKAFPTCKAIQAGEVWKFAFEAKIGDWVICPSSATKHMLIGEIISEYLTDFDGEFGFSNYRHLRKVRWIYSFPENDTRYSQLNNIGMLAFSNSRFSIDQVKAICETK